MLKKITIACMLILFAVSITEAQQRYDELTFPELNAFQPPEVTSFTTSNGIQFFLVEDRELPLIDLNVMIRTGGVLVPAEKEGLASLTGTVLRTGGTETWPGDDLNELLETKAASMETGIGFSSGFASMNVLKEDFEELLPVFIDLLQNPVFPEDKIELAKTQSKSGISRRNDNAGPIASREFQKLIYGEDSPYARTTEYATIDAVTREDMIEFHGEHFNGSNMMIGVVGDFDADEMRQTLEEAFGVIPEGTPTELDFPEVNYEYGNTINLVDKPDVNQSTVLLGHIGGTRENPDYASVQVMNQVLSGGFSGRLFQVVRTDMGLAYSVGGSYGMGNTEYPGVFIAQVQTKSSTTAEAIDAILEQVERLQEEPITEEELQDTKDRFLNSLVFRNDSYEKVLGSRMSNTYRGLSEDAFDEYVEGVKATTVEDVQRVAKTYLHPDQMHILVVGNKDEMGDQLQKYGDVNEIDITIPQPENEEAEEVVEGDAVRGRELLNLMTEALIEPGTEVDKISTEGTITQYNPQLPGGKMDIETSGTVDYPDAVEQVMSTPQGDLTLSYSDGQGTMSMMGQEGPMPPQYVQQFRQTLNRDYLAIALNNAEYSPEYIGSEEYEGATYEKMRITIDGTDITWLIDPDTGYPKMMRYREFNPQTGSQATVEGVYSDWQQSGGVSFAYKVTTYVDGEVAGEETSTSHRVNN